MSVLREEGDRFDLARFYSMQQQMFDVALGEIQRGKKESHWMWFIFPQLAGLGSSAMANYYALHSMEEARAYLRHPVLGPRLLECSRALLSVNGKSASEIMGYPDDLKLRSSMTLFALVAESEPEFRGVLEKYFGGEQDERTLALLKRLPKE